jgi:hypothetical protein
MERDAEPIYIALSHNSGVQTYTLVHRGKRLKTYPNVAEAIAARTKLEKKILEEAR